MSLLSFESLLQYAIPIMNLETNNTNLQYITSYVTCVYDNENQAFKKYMQLCVKAYVRMCWQPTLLYHFSVKHPAIQVKTESAYLSKKSAFCLCQSSNTCQGQLSLHAIEVVSWDHIRALLSNEMQCFLVSERIQKSKWYLFLNNILIGIFQTNTVDWWISKLVSSDTIGRSSVQFM